MALKSSSLWTLAALASAFLFVQCASKPKDLKGDCRDRFDKLQSKYDKGKYAYTKEGFSDFIVTCAGTEYVEQAHFELANSHFSLKEWMEAEEEFGAFLKDYPTSRRYAETARWRMALAMGHQVEIPQRDQSKTVEAIREFETYAAEFPDSPRADSAQAEVTRLSQLLADRDMLIARLYRRMDEPLAAAIYYKYLLAQYGDKVPRRDINLNLAECYIELKQFPEAENILIQFDGVAKDDPFLEKLTAARHKLEKAKAKYEKAKEAEKREEQKRAAPSNL